MLEDRAIQDEGTQHWKEHFAPWEELLDHRWSPGLTLNTLGFPNQKAHQAGQDFGSWQSSMEEYQPREPGALDGQLAEEILKS